MQFIGKTEKSKLTPEELEKLVDVIEISDEATAIMEEIKFGFDRLRLSNLTRR